MIIRDGSFTAYQEGQPIRRFNFTVNAYWVTAGPEGQEHTFVRRPERDDWLDERHKAITEALEALEEALSAAVWL
jgi:hypothetical protein